MPRFSITVKNSHIQIAHIMGRDVHNIRLEDMDKVIEVEAYLEKLTGHRFHINIHREPANEMVE